MLHNNLKPTPKLKDIYRKEFKAIKLRIQVEEKNTNSYMIKYQHSKSTIKENRLIYTIIYTNMQFLKLQCYQIEKIHQKPF